MTPTRVLIADDHRLFAKTLEALLAGEADFEVVGIAEDGVEALQLATVLAPDVVLMDVDMPRLDGLAATKRLRLLGGPAVVLLSAADDAASSPAALEAGAVAYLTKDRVAHILVDTLRKLTAARASLSADGGADLAGRAHVG